MKINAETFSFLEGGESLIPGWNNIGHQELEQMMSELIEQEITPDDAPDVFKAIEVIDSLLKGLGQEGADQVLGIFVDEAGLIDKVLGPAVFADEDKVGCVLKIGSELVPVSFNKLQAAIGELTFDVSVAERKIKDEDGNEINSFEVSLDTYLEVVDEEISLPLILNSEAIQGMKKTKFKNLLNSNKNIAEYLQHPSEGGVYRKIKELENGEYALVGIEENKPHAEYGRSWLVTLEGVGKVFTGGKQLHSTLSKLGEVYKKRLEGGSTFTFTVNNKTMKNGDVIPRGGIFTRPPRPDRLVKVAKPVQGLKSAEPATALPEAHQTTIPVAATPVKEPALVGASAGVTIDPNEVSF
ncbi:MAG: hypothetical protein F6K42_14690 [Leptolyngbya sp. SIO1D8]|nr:hypothetical protein [Leptolyngbya sp. SIO1D8]